jgi:predicted TIM-barrel fold metal-dependent hydrolase
MIIDIHTHTPRDKVAPPPEEVVMNAMWRPDAAKSTRPTWQDYVDAMQVVDKSVCFNMAADPRGTREGDAKLEPATEVNDTTAEFARAHSDKVLGFLSVHPHDPNALEEIERATQDLGLVGIKLGPNYQNFDPVGPEAFKIYARAQELKDFAHPRHMDRVATAFPDLKIVMAHVGHPWQIDCIVVIRKHPNVYADISANFYRPWSYYNELRLATEWSVLHKLFLGSDFPVATPQETIDALWRVNDVIQGTNLPEVPLGELEKLLHRNSLELLGLPY